MARSSPVISFDNVRLLFAHSAEEMRMKFEETSRPDAETTLGTLHDLHTVPIDLKKFANGEILPQLTEDVRGKNIYIFATGMNTEEWSVNDHLMETFLIIDACKRSDVKSITLIMPCFPYIRQDKKDKPRVPISASFVAHVLAPYIRRLVVVDVHFAQFQGFFSETPVDNLYTTSLFCDELRRFTDPATHILISPDGGGVKRIEHYARTLGLKYAVMNKTRDHSSSNKVEKITLYYDPETPIEGKIGIIVDDIIDTGGTLIKACEALISYGISKVIAVSAHGILSDPAIERINSCEYLETVYTSDSLPQSENCRRCEKIRVVSILPILLKIIEIIETGGSISTGLFTPRGRSPIAPSVALLGGE